MYDSAEYASSRLSGTVIRLNGKAVLAQHFKDTDDGIVVTVTHILSGGDSQVNLLDLDITPAPLGWGRLYKNRMYYLARVPKRRDWKQGLRAGNYTAMYPSCGCRDVDMGLVELAKCIEGTTLVSYNEACLKPDGAAFHREWAFVNNKVFNKWYEVGDFINGSVVFYPKYSYLESRFYEDVLYANMASTWVGS